MHYMLMIYGDEARMQAGTPEHKAQRMAAFVAYTEALQKAGVHIGGTRLQPVAAATTVRVRDGASQVLDGPYADSKEQLGGYYLIDVPDLDTALSWAARCPGASYGAVEVRPLWSGPYSDA